MVQQFAAQGERLCQGCDAPNPADAAFCTSCGQSLASLPRPVAQAQPGRRCGACGNQNPLSAVYCVTCGAGLGSGQPAPGQSPVYVPAFSATMMPAYAGGPVSYPMYAATPTQVPLVARVLWFLLVGLWAGSIWIVAAWLLNLTLIGLPLGMWMIGKLPQVMTMRPQRQRAAVPGTQIAASMAVRAIYFVLIGWWLSLVWLMMAWVAAATVIGLPVAFIMFERTPTITTLSDV